MRLKIYTVDAFSRRPFGGNPAAVVPLTQPLSEDVMQKIAFELNLSETAFVTSRGSWTDGNRFKLRWFTPIKEVPLCGHATLATAHILFNILGNWSATLEFDTLSGVLVARRQDKGEILLDFPANPPSKVDEDFMAKYAPLVEAVVGRLAVNEVQFSRKTGKMLIRLEDFHSRKSLESLEPNKDELLRLSDGSEVKGVIVTLLGDLFHHSDSGRGLKEYDFVSRYFAPWVGIPEDPVTGSAHTVLAPYWSKQLHGVKKLNCRQCSARGGDLAVTAAGDKVLILGQATTVIEGEINI